MANTIVRVYNSFSDAENARKELLDSGFSSSSVNLSSREDEAGPVEGNFTVGNKDTETGVGGLLRSLIGGKEPYVEKYGNVTQRGSYLLTVDGADEAQLAQASSIMDRFGAVDIDERTRNSGSQPI
jgi:hypothetical protein